MWMSRVRFLNFHNMNIVTYQNQGKLLAKTHHPKFISFMHLESYDLRKWADNLEDQEFFKSSQQGPNSGLSQ